MKGDMPILKDNLELLPEIDESYIELKVNLDFSIKNTGIKSLAVLSVNSGEGRTTCCMNLAAAYANAGKKVVIIDTDLRKPSVHLQFRDSNQQGLSNYLSKRAHYGEIVKDSGHPNLMYIPAGNVPVNPSQLLSSVEMDLLMQELKDNFDVIIADTPPAQKSIDAKIMVAKCDGVLLVTQYGKVKPTAALKLKEELTHADAHLVGVVLNKVTGKKS
ncbi:CpsD/CapB family tyrosine-protein kinase [Paenibacillus sp. P26]|nr:CpsD/CapB family tyrosine-protein kinase [Paenibacillus sp. P26]UUZ93042.1 CpsD/CapB family tyrosine-protein kinase [Paenibacillus sp. P25]